MLSLNKYLNRWIFEYYYLFITSITALFKSKEILAGNNLVICKGGIGDTVICINIMNTCSEFCSKTIILTKVEQIEFIEKFCKHKLLGVTLHVDENLLKSNSVTKLYSIRSSPKELREIISYNCVKYISINPVFDSIRLMSRLMTAISPKYKKLYYAKQNMHNTQSKILNLRLPIIPRNENDKQYISCYENLDNRNIGFHVAGGEPIRKIKKETIKKVIDSMPTYKFHLLGGVSDIEDYPESYFSQDNAIYKIGRLKLSEMPDEISKFRLVVCPDSMIMHLSDSLYIPIVALMGNALPSTWGPIYAISKIISLYPKCSPCKMRVCNVYEGNSCIQAIDPLTIKSSILELIATINSTSEPNS